MATTETYDREKKKGLIASILDALCSAFSWCGEADDVDWDEVEEVTDLLDEYGYD